MQRVLKVRGKPGVLVPDPFALGTNPPRFVGKRLDYTKPTDAPVIERHVDFDQEVQDHNYIRAAVKQGHLEPVDAETADACGVSMPSREDRDSN